jgi:chromosome segregation ATPase
LAEQLNFPLKNWLTLAAVGFGTGCLCALILRQGFPQAAQVGLATVPALAGSVLLTARQRQEHVSQRLSRQLVGTKTQLSKLQLQHRQLSEYLQGQEYTYQNITQQVQYLQNQQAQLYQDVQTEQFRQRELADAKYLLERKLQHQQLQVSQVTAMLHQRQSQLSELDLLVDLRQSQLQQLEQRQTQLELKAQDSRQTQAEKYQEVSSLNTKITDLNQLRETLQAEIVGKEVFARQLEQQIGQLQEQQVSLQDMVGNLNELITQKQALFQELDGTIGEHQRMSSDHTLEINRLETVITNLNSEILLSEQQLQIAQTQLQSTLVDLNYQQAEFMITPAPTWQSYFVDNPHLPILMHLDKHGAITEAEAIQLLGSPRSVRQFASKISEYAPYLPFSVHVEFSPTGSRYIRQVDGFVT